MIRYLIKNNFKLMSRSLTNVILFIVGPLLLVALLSSAFNDLMSRYDSDDNIVAGYRIEDSDQEEMIKSFVDEAKDSGLVLREFPSGDPEEILREEEMGGFVVFKKDTYTIYQNNDYKEEAKALEFALNAFYEGIMAAITGADPDSIEIKVEHPDYMKPIDSTDYYGIIEVIYFGWCAIVCGAGIFMSEKKYKIGKKLRVSNLNETQLYLAKFVPILSVVYLGNIIAAILTMVLFGVHWGSWGVSALIILVSSAAATAFGLMVYNLSDNIVVTIIAVFAIVWFAGFFGGSFETYMFSAHPLKVKMMSPIYHINRALTELSCMGRSDFVSSALIISVGIMIVCSLLAIMFSSIRRRGKA